MIAEADQLIHCKRHEEDGQLPHRGRPLDPLPPLLVLLRDILLDVPVLLIVQGAQRAGVITRGFLIIIVVAGGPAYHWGSFDSIFSEINGAFLGHLEAFVGSLG